MRAYFPHLLKETRSEHPGLARWFNGDSGSEFSDSSFHPKEEAKKVVRVPQFFLDSCWEEFILLSINEFP